jgi:O-antigen ligase
MTARALLIGPDESWPRRLLLCALTGAAGSAVLAALASGGLSPVLAFLAVAGLVVTAGMIASPTLAILMLCLSLPFERIGRFTNDVDPIAISVNRIFGVIAFGSLLVHATLRRKELRLGPVVLLYGGYTAVALLSNVWAYSPDETFRSSFRVAGNLVFFVLVWNLIRSYADAKRAVLVWLVASIAAALFSLGNYYITRNQPLVEGEMGLTSTRLSSVVSDGAEARSIGMNVKRLFGTTAHPTLFGLNNTMTLPFFLWAMRRRRGPWAWFGIAGLVLALACIVLANTRAIFLLAALTIAFCFVRRLADFRAFVVFVLLGLAAIPFIPGDVYRRSLDFSLYTAEKGDAIRVRFKFWAKSWELIQQTWMHGIGVGDETTLQKMITDEDTGYLSTDGLKASAHNEYIWVMVEVGIVGYLFHWGFVGAVTRSSFRAASLLKRHGGAAEQYFFMIACQALLVGILLFAVQSEGFHYPLKGWWLIAAVSCSMLAAVRRQHRPAVEAGL